MRWTGGHALRSKKEREKELTMCGQDVRGEICERWVSGQVRNGNKRCEGVRGCQLARARTRSRINEKCAEELVIIHSRTNNCSAY